mgnify:CR=1 FL=1
MTKADLSGLEATIEKAFDERDQISTSTRGEIRDAIEAALDLLDRGEVRVAEKQAGGAWHVNQWLKKAVLLSFRLNDMTTISGGPGGEKGQQAGLTIGAKNYAPIRSHIVRNSSWNKSIRRHVELGQPSFVT